MVATIAFARGVEPRGPTARLDADAYYYYLPLASLAASGDLDFTDEYAAHGNWYGFARTPIGRPGNVFGVGPAVFEAPLFVVGRAITLLRGGARDGWSPAEVTLSLYASVLATAGAWYFAARVARRRVGAGAAPTWTTFAVLAAGPVYYYAVRQPGYAHPFGSLFAAWLIDAWDRDTGRGEPRDVRAWVELGALFGATALARPQLATWIVVPIAALAEDLRLGDRRRVARNAAVGVVTALLVFSPQLAAWRAIYGSALLVPQGAGFMRFSEPALLEVLFSARNGLFAWSPLYAVALVGLALEARRTTLARVLLLGVVLQTVVNGAAWDWWAGGSFGGRRFCSTYVAFAYGLAALFARARGEGAFDFARLRDQALALPVVVLVLGNVALAQSYGVSTVRIQGGVAPSAIMRERLPARLGVAVGIASDAVMTPARALFALRYGGHMETWDRVVGVNLLDELYPGLNVVTAPHDRAVLSFAGAAPPPFALGFSPRPEGLGLEAGKRGRFLLSFNERRPKVRVRIAADAPLDVRANGSRTPARLGDEHAFVEVAIGRGVSVLDVEAERPVTVRALHVEAVP